MEGTGRRPSAASKPGTGAPLPDFSGMIAELAEATALAGVPAAAPATAPAPAEQLDFGALMAALGQESAAAGGADPKGILLADMMAALGGPAGGPDASSELQAMLAGLTGQGVEQGIRQGVGQEAAPAAPEPAAAGGRGGAQRLDYSAMLAGLAELTPGSERVTSGADRLEEPAPAEGAGEGLGAFPPVIQQCVTRPAVPLRSPLGQSHGTYVQSP